MTSEILKKRTKEFAVRVIKLVQKLSKSQENYVLGNQLLRSATSVGANYRSACRARSKADFISKITVVEEEADECAYWLELIIETGLIKENLIKDLLKEANELTAIFVSIGKSTKENLTKEVRNPK